jgi:tryptophanyl-tRNA synthetase
MRILSGIQPSGQLHLGNYFGAIRPNLEMIGKAEQNVFFIADLHALTTLHNAKELSQSRKDVLLDYLACGFDPEKAVIFYQSHVHAHTELMWILSTLTPMGFLERAVSYKDKVEKGIAATAGLFTYPVLMAADILLYDATHVPVGKDQKQHLEIARDLAMKFNNAFGETFILPEPMIREETSAVPGVDGQKMSKSYGNTIPLFGDEKIIKKAIMGIVTDSKGPTDPKDPDSCIVYQIHKLFLDPAGQVALAEEYKGGIAYGDAKKKLLEAYMDHFGAMRERRAELAKDEAYLSRIAEEGAKAASELANKTLKKAYMAVGLN